MSKDDLVTIRNCYEVKDSEKGIAINLDFVFNGEFRGASTVWFPKSEWNSGTVPRWLIDRKQEEIQEEYGYQKVEILIDELEITEKHDAKGTS